MRIGFEKEGEKSKMENEKLGHIRFMHVLLSHHVLAFFYGSFLFLYELSITQEMVSAVHPVLIMWSAAVVLYDIFVRRLWRELPYRRVLALFILSVSITTCLTIGAGGTGNIKIWLLVILPVLIIYPICFEEKEERQKNYMIAFSGVWILNFIASLVSLYMFFIRFGGTVEFLGRKAFAGIYRIADEGIESYIVLQGLYKDSGHAATYATVSVVFSCIMFLAFRKGLSAKKIWNYAGQVFCVFDILVQLSYFVLANSRGGWLSLFAGIFIGLFVFVLFRWKGFFRALVIAVFGVTVSGFVLVNARDVMSSVSIMMEEQEAGDSLPDSGKDKKEKNERKKQKEEQADKDAGSGSNAQKGQSKQDTDGKKAEEEVRPDSFERPKESGGSIGSGRLALWKEALELFVKRPVFGDGAGNAAYFAERYDVGERLRNGKAIHNSYLDLLVDYGITGFVLLMGFYILCAGKVWAKLTKEGGNCENSFFFGIAGIVMILSASFFLSCCFVNTTAMYFSNLLLVSYLLSGSTLTDQRESKAES